MASDGTYDLIYFLAYRSGPEDFEYIVGPASLNEFASNATEFQDRADASEELLAPGKLIDKYTSWANLDEAALGKYLMKQAATRKHGFHMDVGWTDGGEGKSVEVKTSVGDVTQK